ALERFRGLQDSRRDFIRVIEEMPDGMAITSEQGSRSPGGDQVVYLNSALERILEASPRESWIGRTVDELFRTSGCCLASQEVSYQTPSGRNLILEASIRRGIRLGEKPCSLLIVRDVTERRSLELAHLERRRLAALGEMAAEMAHEI